MAFQCVLVTPEEQLLDESIVQAIVPAHDGLVGILTDRAPLLVKLGTGPLRLDLASGSSQYFLIDGGVAQMKDDNLTIVTGDATPASEIDSSRVLSRTSMPRAMSCCTVQAPMSRSTSGRIRPVASTRTQRMSAGDSRG